MPELLPVKISSDQKEERTTIGGTYDFFGDVRMYFGYQFGQDIKTPRQGARKAIGVAKYDPKDSKAAEG